MSDGVHYSTNVPLLAVQTSQLQLTVMNQICAASQMFIVDKETGCALNLKEATSKLVSIPKGVH